MTNEILALIQGDTALERLQGEYKECEYRLSKLRVYIYNNPHCNFVFRRQERVMSKYLSILKEKLDLFVVGDQNGD